MGSRRRARSSLVSWLLLLILVCTMAPPPMMTASAQRSDRTAEQGRETEAQDAAAAETTIEEEPGERATGNQDPHPARKARAGDAKKRTPRTARTSGQRRASDDQVEARRADKTRPETTITDKPTKRTDRAEATFTYASSEPDATFACKLDDGDYQPCDPTGLTYPDLADGKHVFRVRASDAAGNTDKSPASHTWTVDTRDPSERTQRRSAKPQADDTSPKTSREDRTSPKTAREERTSPRTSREDNTPPKTAISENPAARGAGPEARFAYSSSEPDSTFACALDDAGFAPCDAAGVAYSDLAAGRHVFKVRATDAAGNTDKSPASHAWTVGADRSEPPSPRGSRSGPKHEETGVPFSDGFEDGNLSGWSKRTGLRVQGQEVATGDYAARGTGAGKVGRAVKRLSQPQSDLYYRVKFMLIEQGKDRVNLLALWTAAGDLLVSLQVNADGFLGYRNAVRRSTVASTVAVTKGTWHEVEIRVRTGKSGQVEVWFDGHRVEELSRRQALGAKAIGRISLGEHTKGHTFDVAFDDVAVDTSFIRSDIVANGPPDAGAPPEESDDEAGDTAPPETTIESAPAALTNTAEARFAFAADELYATFECAVDDQDFRACTSPDEFDGLADGEHTFAVRAIDAAGNVDPTPASHSWTVDTTAPTIAAVVPADETTDVATTEDVEVVFSEPMDPDTLTKATVRLVPRRGSRAVAATIGYDPAAHTLTLDPDAELRADTGYTLTIKSNRDGAKDEGGNRLTGTRESSFRTAAPAAEPPPDAAPIETTIDQAPTDPTDQTTASFAFSAGDPTATFECSLDDSPFAPCASPADYTELSVGGHSFDVRAVDGTGNADETPASHRWTIIAGEPAVRITAQPADPSNDASPTFEFTSDAGDGAFECSLDGADFVTCASPMTYGEGEQAEPLGEGPHTFAVRAAGAGEEAAAAWTIDTLAPTVAAVTPADGAGDVPTDVTIEVVFSEAMDPETLTADTFSLTPDGGEAVALAVNHDRGAERVTLDPKRDLAPATTYTLTVTTDVADPAGNQLAAVEVRSFTTVGEADPTTPETTAPDDATAPETTIAEAPPDPSDRAEATFVLAASEPGSTFECALDGADFAECASAAGAADGARTSRQSRDQSRDPGDGSTAAGRGDRQGREGRRNRETDCGTGGQRDRDCAASVTLTGLADGEHTFRVRAIDAAGNADPTPADHTWTVATTAPPSGDATPPTIIDKEPVASSKRAATTTRVMVTFSEEMDPSTLTATTFTLKRKGRKPVAAEVTYHAATRTATLTPAAALAPEATYAVTIKGGTGGATDLTGTPLAANEKWFFSTVGDRPERVATADSILGLTFEPEADAQVESNNPDLNLGSSTNLIVDGLPPTESYLRFAVDGVVGTVTQATLRVHTTSYSASGTDDGPAAHAVADTTWDEQTITWNTKPARTDPALANVGAIGSDVWVEYDVTSVVTGDGAYSFSLVPEHDDRAYFYSREELTNSAFRPQLVLTVTQSDIETTIEPPVPVDPTNQTTATFAFSASQPGASFECRLDGAAFAPCASPAEYPGLTEGQHTFEVRAIDTAGNPDPTPASFTWSIDTTPPTVTAEVPTDGTTDVAPTANVAATFSEAMDPATLTSATFTLVPQGGGAPIAAIVTYDDPTTTATLDPDADLTVGTTYTATVTTGAQDAAGNPLATDETWSFTVAADTEPPETTIEPPVPADPTTETTATFTFSANEPVATFECRLDGAAFAPCTSPAEYPGLTEGEHTFEVQATDAADNTDPTPASHTWTVDTTAPSVTNQAPPNGATDVSVAANVAAVFSEAMDPDTLTATTFTLAPQGGADVAATVTYEAATNTAILDPDADLEAGTTYTATVGGGANGTTDVAGNPLSADEAWSFTTAAADNLTFAAEADATVNSGFPNQNYGGTNSLDSDGSPVVESYLRFSVNGVGGTVSQATLRLHAYNGTGNGPEVYPAENAWEEGAITWNNRPARTGGPVDDLGAIGTDTWAEFDVTELVIGNGTYTFNLASVSSDGVFSYSKEEANTSLHPQLVLTVQGDGNSIDTTIEPPVPADPTNQTTATFTFSASQPDATFECRLDGDPFAPCTSPATYNDLADGSHTFRVRATSVAGNTDPTPASHTWTVDATAPTVTNVTPADGATNVAATANVAATFSEAMDPATLTATTFTLAPQGGGAPVAAVVTYDPATTTATLDPDADLTIGTTYTATVTTGAQDAAGNPLATDEVWSFTVADTVPPETTIEPPVPTDPTTETTATFTFSANEPGSTFECRLDGAAFAPCSSPAIYNDLDDGGHTFRVRAIDAAANPDPTPATHTWTVDTTAPTVTLEAPPDGATGVPINAEVAATFSEAMDAATLTTATFTLAPQGGGGTVAATVTYDPATHKATLDPDADLTIGTTYTATVTTGAQDAVGNPLAADEVWSFTTVSGASGDLTFGAEADARVSGANPDANFGAQTTLEVDSPDIESFLRFTVSDGVGFVTGATLRLWVTTSGTNDGPAVYAVADNTWGEGTITWNNKPARSGEPSDDLGPLTVGTWAEFDLTELVTGNGTFSFNLVPTSGDGVNFRSKEHAIAEQRPQLVVTFGETPLPPTVTAAPAGAVYASPQSVTLTPSQPSTIYYTTDGSDPTTSGTRIEYGGPIDLSAPTLLKFYGIRTLDNAVSPVVTEIYTILDSLGYRGFSTGASSAPTAKSPESKLWFNDGSWWGVLYNFGVADNHIYRLDMATQTWIDTGVVVDDRISAKADVLWDGTNLYTLSHLFNTSSSGLAQLRRFSYDAGTDTYSLDFGPIPLSNIGAETMVLDKDSTGTLWATFVEGSQVYVTHTLGSDDEWTTPFVLPVSGSTVDAEQDDSTLVAFDGKIGVMWSNQCQTSKPGCSTDENRMYFAWHADGAPNTAWTQEVAYDLPGNAEAADDHMSLKAAADGRVYAAAKTSLNEDNDPFIHLLVREPNGAWTSHTVTTAQFMHTRPIVVIDEQHGLIYVFSSGGAPNPTHGGNVYLKVTSMSDISFSSGEGSVVLDSSEDPTINNVTSSKHPVDATTGLVILAADDVTSDHYLHNVIQWD